MSPVPTLPMTFSINGTYQFPGKIAMPLEMEVQVALPNVKDRFPSIKVPLSGAITLKEFTSKANLRGDLSILPFKRVDLTLEFKDGTEFAWVLQAGKDFQLEDIFQAKAKMKGTLSKNQNESDSQANVMLDFDFLGNLNNFLRLLGPS